MNLSLTSTCSTPIVVIDEGTLQQNAKGSITGVVYWRLNGCCFPDSSWNDFVIVVLTWWTAAISRMLIRTSNSETLDFMDGPYSVYCNRTNNLLECNFVERQNNNFALATWTGGPRELGVAIFDASHRVLQYCHERGWASADIQTLEKEMNALRRLI